MEKEIPYFKQPDNTHCFQACLKMILKYFFPEKEFTYEELDEISDKPRNLITLKAMDIKVERNAFGRQKESFESMISIKGLNSQFNAVFIRAPIIKKIWNDCEELARFDGKIVMVRQNKFLALSFHPELTDDTRVHEYFLNMIF